MINVQTFGGERSLFKMISHEVSFLCVKKNNEATASDQCLKSDVHGFSRQLYSSCALFSYQYDAGKYTCIYPVVDSRMYYKSCWCTPTTVQRKSTLTSSASVSPTASSRPSVSSRSSSVSSTMKRHDCASIEDCA